MTDVDELKRYFEVHARAQRIKPVRYRAVLDRVHRDTDGGPGSWVGEWSGAAQDLAERGDHVGACRYYNMARFPFVDCDARAEALNRCVAAFEVFAADKGFRRLELAVPGGRVRCWSVGLSVTQPRPVLLVMGGIVSIKEQWAPLLARLAGLGMAGLVAEMPGVGENTTRYTADSWQLFPALLDAIAEQADVTHTYALALSFSGHLALRAAASDPRIRGVVTSGAPIAEFFTDAEWQRRVPRLTMATLSHLTGVGQDRLPSVLPGWALTPEQLAAPRIPVAYLVSGRDEIIPRGESNHLRAHVPELWLAANDDVHGSPAHTTESGLWAMRSVLRMRGTASTRAAVLGALLHLLRVRRRLTGARPTPVNAR
ncbi:alpha/beta hydrolase [Amycolatopsis sp. NPDC004079]|uniref:alpha/beta hydrolase n=1 Tax=Amycolatopsis sp. NPDC004079 TaxID=3154549 RepID=UPI0033BE3BB6